LLRRSLRVVVILLFLASSAVGDSRGRFLPAVSYRTGAGAFSVAVADLNGDGKPDLAVPNTFDNAVSILLGEGDGTFMHANIYRPCKGIFWLAAGDLNRDGRIDLVATCRTGRAKNIAVILNSASGFLPPQFYEDGFTTGPNSVLVADFDEDGILDLMVSDAEISFLKGNGDGSFQPAQLYASHGPTDSLVAADFNNDGHLDVAAGEMGIGADVFLGNGDGTFQPAILVGDSLKPVSIAAGDFNRDGHLDLVLANEVKTVTIFLGNGDGSFQTPVTQEVGKGPRSVTVADFNGDGAVDIAVVMSFAGGVTVMFGRGDGTFPLLRQFGAGGGNANSIGVANADLNHDRATDLVVANESENSVSVLMNSGGTFVTATSSENPAPAGQPVTFTATVAPSLISTIPTGSVTFADGTTILATVPLDQNGNASYTTSGLSTGTHTIRTKYSGDSNFNPNTGQPISEVIQ